MDDSRPPKSISKPAKPKKHNPAELDNIDYIRYLNRIILEEAFRMMTKGLPHDATTLPGKPKKDTPASEQEAERNLLLHRHTRMWGNDTPATDMLGDIAETELKIEKYRPSGAASQSGQGQALSEADVVLVRHFIERQQSSDVGDER